MAMMMSDFEKGLVLGLFKGSSSEEEIIQSPQRLRRNLEDEEYDEVKRLIRRLRYDLGWDDSKFDVLAQGSQHEAKKIRGHMPLREVKK